MKMHIFLVLGILLLLGACSDDDYKLSEDGLYQTQWWGKLQFIENEVNKECNITITFEKLTDAWYTSDDLREISTFYSEQMYIKYEINDKIISIDGLTGNILQGNWWIKKASKGELLLKKDPNTEYEFTLTLNKL